MKRETKILVEAQVELMFDNGNVSHFKIKNIPCLWMWDETSRECAEYWAALDYVTDNFEFDWMSIKSWCGSPVKEEIENNG
jgi:hypothetical protein